MFLDKSIIIEKQVKKQKTLGKVSKKHAEKIKCSIIEKLKLKR